MSTNAFSSAGSTISISAGVPATFDTAGFAALTYTLIKEVTDIGTFGKTSGLITHTPINDPTTYKFRGISNPGQLQLKGARVTADAGQTLLVAAAASQASYAFKIVLADATVVYFQGLAMGYQTMLGTAGVITGFDCNVEISGNFA